MNCWLGRLPAQRSSRRGGPFRSDENRFLDGRIFSIGTFHPVSLISRGVRELNYFYFIIPAIPSFPRIPEQGRQSLASTQIRGEGSGFHVVFDAASIRS